MKLSLRISLLLIAVLLILPALGNLTPSQVVAQPNLIQITDVEVPNQVAQAERGQLRAIIHNPQNQSFDGFAIFTDDFGEMTSHNPSDPFINIINFTISPESDLSLVIDFSVAENATIGTHIATFEISVGGYSFLFEQYEIMVIPAVTITAVVPGHVFSQGQAGALVVSVENRVDRPRTARIEVYGSKFINATEVVELAPGLNNVVVQLFHNASHVYDFGMPPVNISIYYNDQLVDSLVILVPVDMTLINKVLAVILPVTVFLLIVVYYLFRKRQRLRAVSTSE